MNWNQRITVARKAAGLGKSGLAVAVKVSPPTVTDWESGKIKNIDGENLLRVCDALKVSPYWLMRGEEAPDQPEKFSKETMEFAEKFEKLSARERRKLQILYMVSRAAPSDEETAKILGDLPTDGEMEHDDKTDTVHKRRATDKTQSSIVASATPANSPSRKARKA